MANENQTILGAGQDTAHRAPKTILDVCCGPRGMWFNKNDNRVVFHDKRNSEYKLKENSYHHYERTLVVKPDIVGDFTMLSIESGTFNLVVFDPPHANFGTSSVMANVYGTLKNQNWQDMIRRGFSECFRVLVCGGVLIFKWCEVDININEILKLTNEKPLFGHRSGKRMDTHWVCFMKEDRTSCAPESPAQNTMEICHTAPNSAMLQGLKPHAGNTGTSA
jgi:hypothetical protein